MDFSDLNHVGSNQATLHLGAWIMISCQYFIELGCREPCFGKLSTRNFESGNTDSGKMELGNLDPETWSLCLQSVKYKLGYLLKGYQHKIVLL